MVVPVALVLAAELQQVIPLQHADVVAEEVVMSIPEASADVLGVDVKRGQNVLIRFTEGLERATQTGSLRRGVVGGPRPVVPLVAVVEVVGGIGADGGGQAGDEEPGL